CNFMPSDVGERGPRPFEFDDVRDVEPGAVVTSNEITVEGVAAPVTIEVASVGGQAVLLVNGAAFTGSTVGAGDRVSVRVTASRELGRAVTVTVTIGSVSGTFTVTTRQEQEPEPDPDPDPDP